MSEDIVERLREPNDGVLSHKWGEMRRTMKDAADEIERLRNECHKLAGYLMSELVFVHERLIEEIDVALEPYLGG